MLISTQLSGFGAGGVAAYTAQGVYFDGTNDYLLRGGDLTGAADSKLWTGSFWLKRTRTGVNDYVMDTAGGGIYRITINTSDFFQIDGRSAGSSILLRIRSSAITDTAWHHFLFSIDLADEAKRHLFVDDVSDLTVITYTNDIIDFTHTEHSFGALSGGFNPFNGDAAEAWMDFGRYVDFSVESNRRKFITAEGCPVDLGSDGSEPFGAAPIMYFSGDTDAWHTNKGTGGGFTETGALTDAATNPCG